MTKYKFRAECSADAQVIRGVLLPWLRGWTDTPDEEMYPWPDVVVEFSIAEGGGISYEEMLWLVDNITDCHVAAETLVTADQYTGERCSYDDVKGRAKRPAKAVMDRILDVLDIELDRTLDTVRAYQTATTLDKARMATLKS